jgi:hypothetical protein
MGWTVVNGMSMRCRAACQIPDGSPVRVVGLTGYVEPCPNGDTARTGLALAAAAEGEWLDVLIKGKAMRQFGKHGVEWLTLNP